MSVHVEPRRTAYLGMLLAVCMILLYLSEAVTINTLIFIFLAACCVGMAYTIGSAISGSTFLAAAVLLGYFLLPDKESILTFIMMGVYVLFLEVIQPKLLVRCPIWMVWGLKLGLFNLFYVPMVLLLPQLFVEGEASGLISAVLIALGNLVAVMCDYLYMALKRKYAGRIQAWMKGR